LSGIPEKGMRADEESLRIGEERVECGLVPNNLRAAQRAAIAEIFTS
jgi:hypothetical protein